MSKLSKEEILLAEALPDEVSEPTTVLYLSGKINGVSVAIEGHGLAVVKLIEAVAHAGVEVHNAAEENKA